MLNSFKIILKSYFLVILLFFGFRLILFLTETDRLDFKEDTILDVFFAFFMGVRFDIVISGYILFFPALILIVSELINKQSYKLKLIVFYFTAILFTIAFLICGADIPYFNQFFQRFSVGAFEWIDSPAFIFKMIIQEPKYILFSIPTIVLIFLLFKALKSIFLKEYLKGTKLKLYISIPMSLFFLAIMFLGIRGRIDEKSPIKIGTAFFGSNAFLNQLGLNPVFTLIRSSLDALNPDNSVVNLMESKKALNIVKQYINTKSAYNSPIARYIKSDSTKQTIIPNIVLVIMESMSAEKMTRHGNPNYLTPFLDSLSNKSIYFENTYTAGKHTFNGVFSTQFSFPALYAQHTMKVIRKFNGISNTLKNIGYSTSFFIPCDSQFDNTEGFLRANDFDNIYSKSNYPSQKVLSTLGVPDDYMFEYSIPVLNQYHKSKKPFFASFMTASDHGPYIVPDYFKPHSTNIKQQTVEFADWSLRKFLYLAKEQPWFNNTIFIFVADHGAPLSATYDISLDYHHSPLIFYAPKLLGNPKVINSIAGQIDVFPTLMGLINQPYINNTMGIDLLNEKRPYIIVNDDDKVGVLDNEFFLIMRKDTKSKLYKYKTKDKTDYANNYPNKVIEMETYIKSHLQVYQDMLIKNQQYIKP